MRLPVRGQPPGLDRLFCHVKAKEHSSLSMTTAGACRSHAEKIRAFKCCAREWNCNWWAPFFVNWSEKVSMHRKNSEDKIPRTHSGFSVCLVVTKVHSSQSMTTAAVDAEKIAPFRCCVRLLKKWCYIPLYGCKTNTANCVWRCTSIWLKLRHIVLSTLHYPYILSVFWLFLQYPLRTSLSANQSPTTLLCVNW